MRSSILTKIVVFHTIFDQMKKLDAHSRLSAWGQRGRSVFSRSDLRVIFAEDSDDAFDVGLRGLVSSGILIRAAHGVYVYPHSSFDKELAFEQVAATLRRGEYVYVSLESALSRYGIISQIPIDRLTLMTTGRSGEFKTPWGIIEFTHTDRSILDIVAATRPREGPLRFAKAATALRDLRRVGRNIHLIQNEELEDALKEDEDGPEL